MTASTLSNDPETNLIKFEKPVEPHSMVYNFQIEVNVKMMGFDSIRRRKSPLYEGFTGNPCASDLMF